MGIQDAPTSEPPDVLDPLASRRDRVAALMRASCERVRGESRAAPPRVSAVAVDAVAGDSAGFTAIRIRCASGSAVICYADGVVGWPIAARCRVLLAGARTLLDSADPGFEVELQRWLDVVVREGAEQEGERERISGAMRLAGIVGGSDAMRALVGRLLRVSRLSDVPVLVSGETGVGKELVARAVHGFDAKRARGPFVAVNCSAISPGLAESELFGHRQGAYTGAGHDRRGLVRAAHRGVLFLDEVGDLAPALQAKLLRVLQEKRVLAVGEDHEVPIDVRVVAASNQDLDGLVARDLFRRDLLHRLNALSIRVPSLRERREDIPSLVRHFARKHRPASARDPVAVDGGFLEAVAELPFPGNVRELENLVRTALAEKRSEEPLGLNDLPLPVLEQLASRPAAGGYEQVRRPGAGSPPNAPPPDPVEVLSLHGWNLMRALQHLERLLIEAALRRTGGNQAETARILGVSTRTVYNKLHRRPRQGPHSPPS